MNIVLTEPLGAETLLFGEIAGEQIQAKMLNPRPVKNGETLTLQLDLAKCHLFDAETTQSLR